MRAPGAEKLTLAQMREKAVEAERKKSEPKPLGSKGGKLANMVGKLRTTTTTKPQKEEPLKEKSPEENTDQRQHPFPPPTPFFDPRFGMDPRFLASFGGYGFPPPHDRSYFDGWQGRFSPYGGFSPGFDPRFGQDYRQWSERGPSPPHGERYKMPPNDYHQSGPRFPDAGRGRYYGYNQSPDGRFGGHYRDISPEGHMNGDHRQEMEFPDNHSPERPEIAEQQKALAVFNKVFHGVTTAVEDEDQSVMTDDNGKFTQTAYKKGKKNNFIPASLVEKEAVEPLRMGGESESETETDTDSSDWSSGQESSEASTQRSIVFMDAARPELAKSKKIHSPREQRTRQYASKEDRGFVEVEGNAVESKRKSYVPHPPEEPIGMLAKPRKRKQKTAIIEVQEDVELDAKDLEDETKERQIAVPADALASKKPIDEGEFIVSDGEGILPAPSIMVESRGRHGVKIQWELPRQPDPDYRVLCYVVNVVGTRFSSDINSDISFECNLVEKSKQVRGVQHCWNIQDKDKCSVSGLESGMTYRMYVIANYTLIHGQQPCEIQTTSPVIYYTTIGPPKSPKLTVSSVDLYQVLLAWEPPEMHHDLHLRGYQIYVDQKPLGGLRNKDVRQMMINNMMPGKTLSVYVVAVTKQASIESEPSRTIHLTCPRRAPAVSISQQPSYKRGTVLIAWERPEGHTFATNEEDISLYGVYVDGKWYGEVRANKMGNKHGYQYILNDLSPEQSYDINVKAIAGYKRIDPDAQHVFCLSDSAMSNTVPVMAPAAPKSPKLRLEGLHPEGLDVTWQIPQQCGDAAISGYQMLKNGKLYGSIIPAEVNNLRIRDISLGEKVSLQLIALTEHPVGKFDKPSVDSGVGGSSQPGDKTADMFMGEKYSGCKPGAKLVIHYTGLVQPPTQIWCEQVTGHSALIVWNKDDYPKAHFVRPESYQVTWWPGDKPEDDINSDSTTDDHLLITNLRPATSYKVVVEARKMEKYKDIDEEAENTVGHEGINAFILTSKSEHLTVKTASPPDPPRNLGVIATTCNSLLVAWDPPQEHGVEVIGMRIDAISLNTGDPHHVSLDVIPDATTSIVEYLREKTDYLIRVTAITDEYFDRLPDKHKLKKLRSLPKDLAVSPEDSPWLPNASLLTKTAGTEPPANVKLMKSTMTTLTLTWAPPIVYGSNKLQSVIVRWADMKNVQRDQELLVASHLNLLATEESVTLEDLVPGAQYRIIIEAVVSLKTSLEPEKQNSNSDKFRRTAHVMSKPLVVRTRAPTDPPQLLITNYTQTTAQLYWEKPPLVSIVGKDGEGKPKYLRRYLEGYKLEINGKVYCSLSPAAQTCALTKCRAGKLYSVVIVALTCTEDGKKERKRKYKGFYKNVDPQTLDYTTLLDDDECLDPSPSEPLEIVLPKTQEGYLEMLGSRFKANDDQDDKTFGDVTVEWTTQGDKQLLKQFSVLWYCQEDKVIQTKYVSPDFRRCTIPVTRIKSIYDITVEPVYYTDALPQTPQNIQIMIPGPPDAPEIFIKSVSPEEFVIEWGEPRIFAGVKVRGYQVYLNDKKAGNELSNSHRKAVVPCRPNKVYKINLVALSSKSEYTDSPKSNTLMINTSMHSPRVGDSIAMEEWTAVDDHDIPVKVAKVTENAIHLDWSTFLEVDGIAFYKIQWSSVAQPAQREVTLSSKDTSCVINKCLPGTTHFVRLLALDGEANIQDKSKQLTIQTSAPPDAPLIAIRACNFRYIAIQWDKPHTYGDALITGYKVYVNGIVEAILNGDQLSYTFTRGKWCQEYNFQVQAQTAYEKLSSKPSEPLIVTWPGARSPSLHRLPSHQSTTIIIGWDDPFLTDNVKVKHFRLCLMEEDTEKVVQSVGPVHPETREGEFKQVKNGTYNVYLELHLYGTSDVVMSDPIVVQPAPAPDPPHISVTVVGHEERRQLQKLTCDLVNKRDRLIKQVGHKLKQIGALTHPLRAEKNKDVIEGAHTLTRVEELLEECFTALESYTGQIIAHVSWHCPQANPDIQLSGFKVMIDSKQYGNPMHDGIKTVRIKLGTEQPSYRLTMVSMSDKPLATSEESNVVDLLSETFMPFTFYCYHGVHKKDTKWPKEGCCKYQDSIAYERQLAKKLANQGLLKKKVPPPSCSLLDIFEGEYKPLLSNLNKDFPTVILFWTPWCLSSQMVMGHFTRFAKEMVREYNFIAVTCGVKTTDATERKELIHHITANGWREDGILWHASSQCASSIYEATNNLRKNSGAAPLHRTDADVEEERMVDLADILGIAGVPTFLFLHPEGYIAWHGRYSAFDYSSFGAFMRHTFSSVMNTPCPVFTCDCCQNDTSIDEDHIEPILHMVNSSPVRNSSMRKSIENSIPSVPLQTSTKFILPTENGYGEPDEPVPDRLFFKTQTSPKRRKKSGRITVNQRPYSASSYVQQLRSPYLQKNPSPGFKKLTIRPASARKATPNTY
ncbi:hypothetical protein ScPMuIL_007433 [Solemya velum]